MTCPGLASALPATGHSRASRLLAVLGLALLTVLPHADTAAQSANWSEEQLATAARLRDQAVAGSSAYEHVAALVQQIGPRPSGSPADALAVRWAIERLGALGFSGIRTQDVLVPRWIRGSTEVTLLGAAAQPLVAVTLGGSVGTSEAGIEAAVIEFPSLDALAAANPAQVKGRIVFINERMERSREIDAYAQAVRKRVAGPSVAGDKGALALLIRTVGTSKERFANTGGLRYSVDAPRIPAFALSNPDADTLGYHLSGGKPVRVRVKSTARELPPGWSANVIAEIPGSSRPEEIVLLGAHLDTWDLTPGAQDDGAGVAIVMEAARLIAALPSRPARTVRVVLFTNEEFGLSGAREYARTLDQQAQPHVLAIGADFGAGKVWQVSSRVAQDSLNAVQTIAEVLQPLEIEPGDNTASGAPDLGPLLALGVPVLDLVHDGSQYFDIHHSMNDTLAHIDPQALDQAVAAYAAAAYLAASKDGDFGSVATASTGQTQPAAQSETDEEH